MKMHMSEWLSQKYLSTSSSFNPFVLKFLGRKRSLKILPTKNLFLGIDLKINSMMSKLTYTVWGYIFLEATTHSVPKKTKIVFWKFLTRKNLTNIHCCQLPENPGDSRFWRVRTFQYRATSLWNELQPALKLSPSVTEFKCLLRQKLLNDCFI